MSAPAPLPPAAILAGGLATRLRPLTQTIPKALVEVDGEPFLAHQLRLLRAAGIARVVMCVGYLGESIRDFAGTGQRFDLEIDYAFDGPRLLGTAGALKQALPLLGPEFFVLYGDSYLPCDYAAVAAAFRASGRPALMTVFRNEGRWDPSNVEFAEGRILAYDKQDRTPRMCHIDYGLGLFRRQAFDLTPAGEVADLAALYRQLLARGELAACEVTERFYEIGSFEGIEELAALVRRARPRAVFLDRDGVIIDAQVRDGKPYPVASAAEMRIPPDVAPAMARLKQAGFLLIVATNQPDVARGTLSRASVDQMHTALAAALPLDEVRVCCHGEGDACACRKPKPGMLLEAAARHGIDLSRSFMVGDRWRDIDCGAAAGCRTVFLDRGYRERGPSAPPAYTSASFGQAVDWILSGPR
jgi:histidinol-phosphate phosphatase family protein